MHPEENDGLSALLNRYHASQQSLVIVILNINQLAIASYYYEWLLLILLIINNAKSYIASNSKANQAITFKTEVIIFINLRIVLFSQHFP